MQWPEWWKTLQPRLCDRSYIRWKAALSHSQAREPSLQIAVNRKVAWEESPRSVHDCPRLIDKHFLLFLYVVPDEREANVIPNHILQYRRERESRYDGMWSSMFVSKWQKWMDATVNGVAASSTEQEPLYNI